MTKTRAREKSKTAAQKVSRKATARKSSARSAKKQVKPKLVSIEPLIIDLYDLNVGREFSGSEDVEGQIESSSYSCEIRPVVHRDGSVGGQCGCSVDITYTSGTTYNMSANYFFFTKEIPEYLETEAEIVLQYIGKSIVWPRFEMLFAFLNDQAGVHLQKLPQTPQVSIPNEIKKLSEINKLTDV